MSARRLALTGMQEAFCKAIVEGKTQADAYRAANPRAAGWKAATVYVRASELMAQQKIKDRVAELAKSVDAEYTVRTADLLREAARLAFSDVRNIMTTEGKLRLPHELDPDTARSVSSFKMDEFGRVEYKFWDKNNALEKLFKHKGLFKEDNSQKVDPFAELAKLVTGKVVGVVADPDPEDE